MRVLLLLVLLGHFFFPSVVRALPQRHTEQDLAEQGFCTLWSSPSVQCSALWVLCLVNPSCFSIPRFSSTSSTQGLLKPTWCPYLCHSPQTLFRQWAGNYTARVVSYLSKITLVHCLMSIISKQCPFIYRYFVLPGRKKHKVWKWLEQVCFTGQDSTLYFILCTFSTWHTAGAQYVCRVNERWPNFLNSWDLGIF